MVVFGQIEGVHRGPLFGVPASGNFFTSQSVSLIWFRDGQIVRYMAFPDRLGILRQIGGAVTLDVAHPAPPALGWQPGLAA